MRKFLLGLVLLFAFLFIPQASFAEVIHNFDTNIVAHKNGTMDVTETINYDFENLYKHGIYRDIPLFSSVGSLYRIIKIDNIKVLRDSASENFSLSNDSKILDIKIGDANKTITGPHVYKISYSVENGIGSNFPDHDEIYWNITGNGWSVPIESVVGSVRTDFNANLKNVVCYTGFQGSKEQNCTVSSNSAQAVNLASEQGLTIAAVFPVNTFPKSILSKSLPIPMSQQILYAIIKNYLYIFLFLNIILPVILIFWYLRHKNKKRFGPPVVNFDIPKDENGVVLRPALAGTIDTAMLERDDVVATIFDLAIRKYIKLDETKTVIKHFPDVTTQTITKLKEDDGKLEIHEKNLFDFIFATGDSVKISNLRPTFYTAFQSMEKDVFQALVEKGYYTKNPKIQKGLLIFMSVLSFISLNLILGFVLLFLSFKLNGRTAKGDEADYKIDGLKIFLKSMDRNYKWQAKNFYTVEQMIPYAIALGYINEFMEQLKAINPNYSPTWYAGYSGSFYGAYAGFYSSVSSSVSPSSSGGGGGGFSGGGGGGGGGGSW